MAIGGLEEVIVCKFCIRTRSSSARRGIDDARSSSASTLAKPSSWLARKSPGVLDEERGPRGY